MHAVLATIGTDGDVFPFLALGSALLQRGHQVTLLASSGYESLARERGFDFQSLVTQSELTEWFAHPDFWHPTKCAIVGAQWGTKYIERQYHLIKPFAEDRDVVFVVSPAIFAARFVQEQFGTPLVTIILQPWVIHSSIEPPVIPVISLPRGLPRFIGDAYWWLVDMIGDRLVGREVNRVRQRIGLPPIRKLFRWWMSPQRIIGLFPDWYGPPQRDWPPQIRLTGFPIDDGRRGQELSEELRRFCVDGQPPIAFTFGTEMQAAAKLFAASVEACRMLGRRGLLITKYRDQLPTTLPADIRRVEYAPFALLLPLCGAAVHHGGIGTTARCLQAGVPQLITPFAFDQPDNAARVERLGVGRGLSRRNWTGRGMATALEQLLSVDAKNRCQMTVEQFQTDGLIRAAVELETFATSTLRERRNVE